MTCPLCGGPLDPDVTHVQHVDGCPNAYTFTFSGPDLGERVRAWLQAQDDDTCDCPEVCANHCTDPGCVLRPDQETPMTDSSPAPLEPGEVAVIKACIGQYTPSHIARLVATVEQVRRELRQAREAAADVVNVRRSHSFGIATAEMVATVEQKLLDLLAPVPDSVEET